MADEERDWFRAHAEPQITSTPERLSLWNYPGGRTSRLSP